MKKVLIITYYWPPAGGPGVQRILKFVKYLPQFGWEPIVLTLKKRDAHAIDNSLQKDIPNSVKTYFVKNKFSVLDFYKFFSGKKKNISSFELTKKNKGFFYKIILFIRANLYYPDARKHWCRAAIKLGERIISREQPNLIFISSPPQSLQLIGYALSKKFGVKWVADFRDPWTDAFWDRELPRLKWIQQKNLKLEKKIIKSTDSLTTVSQDFAKLLNKDRDRHFHILSNGFDKDDFKNIEKTDSKKFRIVYAGGIASTQVPVNFIEAIDKLPLTIKNNLTINFWGKFDAFLPRLIYEKKLQNIIRCNGYVAHEKVTELMQNAECLLLLIPYKNAEGALTGKVYEYMATGNFILTLAPTGHEIHGVIEQYQNGLVKSYKDDLKDVILEQYDRWQKGEKTSVNKAFVEKFSRKKLTEKLCDIFNETLLA